MEQAPASTDQLLGNLGIAAAQEWLKQASQLLRADVAEAAEQLGAPSGGEEDDSLERRAQTLEQLVELTQQLHSYQEPLEELQSQASSWEAEYQAEQETLRSGAWELYLDFVRRQLEAWGLEQLQLEGPVQDRWLDQTAEVAAEHELQADWLSSARLAIQRARGEALDGQLQQLEQQLAQLQDVDLQQLSGLLPPWCLSAAALAGTSGQSEPWQPEQGDEQLQQDLQDLLEAWSQPLLQQLGKIELELLSWHSIVGSWRYRLMDLEPAWSTAWSETDWSLAQPADGERKRLTLDPPPSRESGAASEWVDQMRCFDREFRTMHGYIATGVQASHALLHPRLSRWLRQVEHLGFSDRASGSLLHRILEDPDWWQEHRDEIVRLCEQANDWYPGLGVQAPLASPR